MSNNETGDLIFTSVYRHSLDGKRRVPVPFRWRPKDPIDFTLMVFPEPEVGNCLRVLPPKQWVQRLVGRYSIEVSLDSAGRITIPEEMAVAADITTTAVLAGSLRHFELWSP